MPVRVLSLGVWLLLASALAQAQVVQKVAAEFEGTEPGSTKSFRVAGPWMLNWVAASEFPMLAHLDIHLYDAETGDFAGVVLQHLGVGNGQKLIRESGRYRLVIRSRSVDWRVRIDEVDGDLAQVLREHPNVSTVRLVPPDVGLPRGLVERISAWEAPNDETLVLHIKDGQKWTFSFYGSPVCPGLKKAQSIFFVTSGVGPYTFDSILLEDGTRCYLDVAG